MMSLAIIRAMSADIAQEAAIEKRVPFVPNLGDLLRWRVERHNVRIPNLGDHVPEGWTRRDREAWWFMDKSGFGADDEPALSFEQFLFQLDAYIEDHPEHGVAIVEEGQFQVYVAPFVKD